MGKVPLGSTHEFHERQGGIRMEDLNALLEYVKTQRRGMGSTPGLETTVSGSAIQMRALHIMGNEENKKPLSYLESGTIANIEDQETAYTGDDQNWTFDKPGDDSDGELSLGFTLPLVSRVVYKDDGDEILYGYVRELCFDSSGHLVMIGDELRYTVDEPEECVSTGEASDPTLLMGG